MRSTDMRIKVFVNGHTRNDFSTLSYSCSGLQFNEENILINSIERIDISLCCSKAEEGHYYGILNLFFVYLDIKTKCNTYSFQLMNNNEVKNLFDYLLTKNLNINDPLQLTKAFNDFDEPLELYNYFNKNFKEWQKNYDLELILFDHSFIDSNYIDPLKEVSNKDAISFKTQILQLINGYMEVFRNKK